uniref:Anoctamin n=1 Tax=Tetraodon nigroviridis TaxID=99883 RepID=H3CZZ3_TETNG
MLRKGSEKKDREVLLDLDHEGSMNSYGSLQNGSSSTPKSVSACFNHSRYFVLVWETSSQGTRPEQEGTSDIKLEQWRERFLRNLRAAGLLMEKVLPSRVASRIRRDSNVHLKSPLQAQPYLDFNSSARWLRHLCIPNIMLQQVPNRPLDYYTCAFRKSKMENFLGSHDQENFFTNTQRHRVAYEILTRTSYGKRRRAQVGVDRLLNEGVFTTTFPLHEGSFRLPQCEIHPEELNRRQILYQYWARWRNWHKYQPLDHIREYFGEKIAFYFAWLGFYTTWLLPAALVGTLVFLSGLMSMSTNTTAKEVCNSGGNYLMCPLCDTCNAWNISTTCTMAKLGYLFDHPGTVFFSIFMSFWSVSFLEYWKRKMVTLAHHWDCMEFHEEEERPRPEFAAMATTMEPNPVTGVKEPYFPEKTRMSRMLTGSMVIVMMLCVVMIFLVTVVMCRGILTVVMFHTRSHILQTEAVTIANILSSIVNLCLILLMGRIYTALAEQLTKWEMHRTQTQYENAFIFKVFIFQFVNFYSSPFYVAFFKGRFVGYPNNYGRLFGMRNEDCGPGGCLIELAQQLFIIMVGKQFINNVQEFVIPKVKAWLQKRTLSKVLGVKEALQIQRWEEDYQLVKCEGLFEEYLEMVLQFGFITIFVAAFPLAPLFALLNNWVEIRLDAHKFVCEYQRPVAERAQNIGVWLNILEILSHMSVTANAFVLAFTSEFLPRLLYQYKFDNDLHGYVNFTLAYAPANYTDYPQCRYALSHEWSSFTLVYWDLLVFSHFGYYYCHVVFFVLRAIDWIIPDIPESLEVKMKRERYLAKQALAENHEVLFQGVPSATPGTSSPEVSIPN